MADSSHWTKGSGHLVFLAFYIIFGFIHEVAHVFFARLLFAHDLNAVDGGINSGGVVAVLARALFGRYSIVSMPIDNELGRAIILHSGWILTCVMSLCLHWYYRRVVGSSESWVSIAAVAAYITSLEGIVTDLFGFIPASWYHGHAVEGNLILYCGNFGVILINSVWVNVDGGKKALDILEKMVEVTMMRGAQSGGVVTFQPTGSSSSALPKLKGIRSRVVNAKRTDLSKGVRRKIEKDNFGFFSKRLSDSNSKVYSATVEEGRLVRTFFGHTRFATSSKASFDGTHPHQWSPRKNFTMYPFQSSSAPQALPLVPESTGVEHYITHNGDFEFYKFGNGKFYDTSEVQQFLVKALGVPMPATVDSAAVAGVIDLLRCQGSWALSLRYAVCFATDNVDPADKMADYPTTGEYIDVRTVFEDSLSDFVVNHQIKCIEDISSSIENRSKLVDCLIGPFSTYLTSAKTSRINDFVPSDEENGGLLRFMEAVVNAFFDNDLLHTTRTFLNNAKGSFGLSISSSLDAHRQVCFAAKGQTLSIAFYPRKGVICYGSEQAAVKAGLNYDVPEGKASNFTPVDEDAMRLDLDDLSGEVCLLDWGYKDREPAVSPPNRSLPVEKLMGGVVSIVLFHQTNTTNKMSFQKRLIPLENNECIKPLLEDKDDPVRADIEDIPRICSEIQADWQDTSLNRLTAWNLAKCIRKRLKGHVDGTIKDAGEVDILLTGCEVSLWLAEQFAADLSKCFPKLQIKTVSSNKLLGLFGQELSMPTIGFPYTSKTLDMHDDPIVIIVSHSGGTFSPLACSNLLQSFSRSIFAITSEWDTQVGKQLRGMFNADKDMLMSRIFSTEVGVRPAEPCSISVAATHQLLTNIFEHIALTIISDPGFRAVTGAIITEQDLKTLERCNQDNIAALEKIVGADRKGRANPDAPTMKNLRAAGDLWSEHILENAKAYIMSFIYIIVTVTSGYPLISGIAVACGMTADWGFYITRFFDAFIYFWLPQINVTILRLIQRRNVRHRMVGRTVVVGDIPWVAQAAEAFLGKIFACSYSIAGCGVISGNPADHLVHRHTHRVVRGSLLICGRPDGRLAALTTAEASVCLAVNQASSIQSIGGTCESITIGHNPSSLPLSERHICLDACRPKFLCEKILDDADEVELNRRMSIRKSTTKVIETKQGIRSSFTRQLSRRSTVNDDDGDEQLDNRSSARLLGAYSNLLENDSKQQVCFVGQYAKMDEKARKKLDSTSHVDHVMGKVINDMMRESRDVNNIKATFDQFDADGNGSLDLQEFKDAYRVLKPNVTDAQLEAMFEEADLDGGGTLDFDEFSSIARLPQVEVLGKLGVQNRDERGLIQVEPSFESYFGEDIRKNAPKGVGAFLMSQSQSLSMELYESRIASMQRFVSMTVMFHQMGMRVQKFFSNISLGLLGYRMDRTHSIMRIATTASPVSGADVRDKMVEIRLRSKVNKAVSLIATNWRKKAGSQEVRNKIA